MIVVSGPFKYGVRSSDCDITLKIGDRIENLGPEDLRIRRTTPSLVDVTLHPGDTLTIMPPVTPSYVLSTVWRWLARSLRDDFVRLLQELPI